jgi:hypothetical protein
MRLRPIVVVPAAVLVAGAGLGIWWFEPHTAFIDDRVDGAVPVVADGDRNGDDGGATPPAGPPPAPVVLADGVFAGLGRYDGEGTALLLSLSDGSRVLRFEDFATSNGPDLFVYLSAAPADGPAAAHDDDFVNLGGLKGNIGSQNYEVGPDVDLDRYRSVVIWCRRFRAGFAVASLGEPAADAAPVS